MNNFYYYHKHLMVTPETHNASRTLIYSHNYDRHNHFTSTFVIVLGYSMNTRKNLLKKYVIVTIHLIYDPTQYVLY